jgi:hypothetical protein
LTEFLAEGYAAACAELAMTPPVSRTGKIAITALVLAGIALLGSIVWIARDRRPQREPANIVELPAPAPAAPKMAPARAPVAPVPAPETDRGLPSPVSPPSGVAAQSAQSAPFEAPRPVVRGLRALASMIKPTADGGGPPPR